MDKLNIPDANVEVPNEAANNSTNTNVDIIELLNDKIKSISKTKPVVEFVVKKKFPDELIKTLEEKGYELSIYHCYNTDEKLHTTKVKIKNPNFSNPTTDFFEKIEKQCRDFGFNANTVNFTNLNDAGINFGDILKTFGK